MIGAPGWSEHITVPSFITVELSLAEVDHEAENTEGEEGEED